MRTFAIAAAVGLAALGCTPEQYRVDYQRQHEAEWVAPNAAASALSGMTEQRLSAAMGRPISVHTATVGDTLFHHYVFCQDLRVFDSSNGEVQYKWWDGGWHPVRWTTCEEGHEMRVMTANGVVRATDD